MIDTIFERISFIKPDRPLKREYTGENLAPMFRKKVNIAKTGNARLYVCGLGYGYFYVNGKKVTEDVLDAPVSDYRKTLWYREYDVTALLEEGENCFAVWCGNGWYNEEFKTSWNHNEAAWRDVPKFILRLDVDGETVLVSDDSWKCLPEGPITFNALRSGEYFDARRYDEAWNTAAFDDSAWENAVRDTNPPTGVFRRCDCEGICEAEIYPTKSVLKTGEKRYVYDLGQNMSGYARIIAKGKAGQVLTIRYGEQLKENGELELNNMTHHYKESPFQTDRLTLSGKAITWSPRFCYHGFRYIEVEGIEAPEEINVSGVFVHQSVEMRSSFACSDGYLTSLFRMGQYSTWSNMFYMITDCPTREKLGWANDAQSSCEQILTDFKAEHVLEKWLFDIYDAMREDGALPGIIPTGGWGYTWGNGPVSDGILFEIPYRIYLHTGNAEPLRRSRPYFDRYFAYLVTREEEDGYVRFGLDDWARPSRREGKEENVVPSAFINTALIYRFYEIAALAARLDGADDEVYCAEMQKRKEMLIRDFVNPDGTCTVPRQTAVSMLIYYHICEDTAPLAKQLASLVEAADFHHDCGMVGLRRLYYALNACGLEEYAYKIITAAGYPGYREWVDGDATTLWEYWDTIPHADSKNHQMYSDFMSWIIKTILGIRTEITAPAYESIRITPHFLRALSYASGYVDVPRGQGKIAVSWKKFGLAAELQITIPEGIHAEYDGRELHAALRRGQHRA
ncbi:MAG: glycoside hydrolase family 78 protein [Clostridia bacterium]|nr:glycoside hydrolase family 78 protein [Clostridia bacterium]